MSIIKDYAEKIVEKVDYDIYKEWFQLRDEEGEDNFKDIEEILLEFVIKVKEAGG